MHSCFCQYPPFVSCNILLWASSAPVFSFGSYLDAVRTRSAITLLGLRLYIMSRLLDYNVGQVSPIEVLLCLYE